MDGSTPESTLIERWLHEQQQWQRTLFNYLDSMMKNDEFLMHLGNAMRGSLLAGKPYPTAAPPGPPVPDSQTNERLDQVLFALRELQGQVQELLIAVDEIRAQRGTSSAAARGKRSASKRAGVKRTPANGAAKTGKRRARS